MAAKPATGARARAQHLGPEKRRPLVLDAARTIYLQSGYDGASMDAIAKQAGVTKPVLYDCYSNKQELFAALLRRENDRLLSSAVQSVPPNVDLEHPADTIRIGLGGFLTSVAAHPESYNVVARAVAEGLGADLAKGLDEHRRAMTSRIRELAQTYLEARGAANAERQAEIASHAMFALGDAFARLLVNQPDAFDAEELSEMARASRRARSIS